MREIQFRAWDEQRKAMHYEFNFIQSFGEGYNWIIPIKPISNPEWVRDLQENITSAPHFREQFKLMQYTGLKDKNGKKIYESDLMRMYCGGTIGSDKEYQNCIIEWGTHFNEAGFCLKGTIKNFNSYVKYTSDVLNDKYARNSEVIGNIYENSELLDNAK